MTRITAYYDDEDLHRIFRAHFGVPAQVEMPENDEAIDTEKKGSGEWAVSYDVPDNKVGAVTAALTKAGYRIISREEAADIAAKQLEQSHADADKKNANRADAGQEQPAPEKTGPSKPTLVDKA